MDSDHNQATIWFDVEERALRAGIPTHYVSQLVKKIGSLQACGEEVLDIRQLRRGEPLFETLVSLYVAEAKRLFYSEQLKLCEESCDLKESELWLLIRNEFGFNAKEMYILDVAGMKLRKRPQETVSPNETETSYSETLESYAQMVKVILHEPLAAGRVLDNASMPTWLRALAGQITSGNLRPHLRAQLQVWLREPAVARDMKRVSAGMDLPNWLTELLDILGNRKRFKL